LFLDKVAVRKNEIEITLREAGADKAAAPIVVPLSAAPASRRREIILPAGLDRADQRPIRAESRARLVEGIAKARLWLNELIDGRVTDTKEIADREGCSDRSIRMTLSLAFLSPSIVQAAVDDTLPQGSGGASQVLRTDRRGQSFLDCLSLSREQISGRAASSGHPVVSHARRSQFCLSIGRPV